MSHFLGSSACKHLRELKTPQHLRLSFFHLGILFACSFEEYISLHNLRSHLYLLSQIKQSNRYHNAFQEGQYKD